MKEKFSLHRRSVLKGLGGLSLGLPLLEVMLDGKNAYAQTAPPKRYIVFFNGQSQGADGDATPSQVVPNIVGANYDLKSALAPLAAVKGDVSVISGLKIPTAFDNGGAIPTGGRRDDFHVSSLSPLLSGVKSHVSSANAQGETSDQVVANFLAGPTAFKSLIYRVQADWYLSVSAPYGRDMISYKIDATNKLVPIPPQTSPRQAFMALFGNFTPPGTDPAAAAAIDFDKRSRRSVLDLVLGDANKMLPKLGAADKLRMQRHLDEVRQLENRIAAIPPPQTGVCVKPADPGADPGVGQPQGNDGTDNTYTQNLGYSNEEQRAKVFCDLIHMAMTCDLSRVASLQMTMFQSHLNMYALTGQPTDCHELGHGGVPGGSVAQAKGIAWHMKHLAYLIQKFKDTQEANGTTLLDNTAIVSLWEGGHGFDPGGNKQNSTHSTENMTALVAGRAGGLKPGKHIAAAGKHPAHVLVSAMKAVGYTQNKLGEVTGDIPELST